MMHKLMCVCAHNVDNPNAKSQLRFADMSATDATDSQTVSLSSNDRDHAVSTSAATSGSKSSSSSSNHHYSHPNVSSSLANIHIRHDYTDTDTQDEYAKHAQAFIEQLPVEQVDVDAAVTTPLMPHQKQALWWLYNRAYGDGEQHPCAIPACESRPRGVILADDMGLGKTLTVLAFLADRKRRRRDSVKKMNPQANEGPVLLICPSSVVSNWTHQIHQHCPTLCALVCSQKTNRVDMFQQHDVVIMAYEFARVCFGRSFDDVAQGKYSTEVVGGAARRGTFRPRRVGDRDPLYQVMWHCIVLDEAHRIRNQQSKLAHSCRNIIGTEDAFRICVSGTPVQNCSVDLTSLIQFLRVKIPAFAAIVAPSQATTMSSTTTAGNAAAAAASRVTNAFYSANKPPIYQLLDRIMLRRKKETRTQNNAKIVDLPPVSYSVVVLEPTKAQALMQRTLLSHVERSLREARAVKTTSSSSSQSNRRVYYNCLLGALRQMQQVADHGLLPFMSSVCEWSTVDELCHMTRRAAQWTPSVGKDLGQRGTASATPVLLALSPSAAAVNTNGNTEDQVGMINPHQRQLDVMIAQLLERRGRQSLAEISLSNAVSFVHATDNEIKDDKNVDDDEREGGNDVVDIDPSKYAFMSNKVEYLMEQIQHICTSDPTAKIVVFSQFVQFLKLMQCSLMQSRPLLQSVLMMGTLTQTKRQFIIQEFDTNPNVRVFLTSLQTGGEGLNLTAANWIYLCDPVRRYWRSEQ